jgi:hypothetical protein
VRRRGSALVLMLALSACAQTFDSTTLGVPVTMAAAPGEAPQGTPFKTRTHSLHAIFGLLTVGHPNLQKALARQLVGGQGIAQLRIKTTSRWSDVLVTVLTAGLLVPRTVTYEGVIVGRPQ